MADDLVIRNVEIDGQPGLDVRIANGFLREIGIGLPRGADERQGDGGALIPGLADHHIHLLSFAAQMLSLNVGKAVSASEFTTKLKAALAKQPVGSWLRVIGYHASIAGEISRTELDAIAPHHPVRMQDSTGILWILNSAAIDALGFGVDENSCIEHDNEGEPSGRIWRGDAWLRGKLPIAQPDLEFVGKQLATWGITAATDASATTDESAAALLSAARQTGALPVRLTIMSAGPLNLPPDLDLSVGPIKILLDDQNLPSFDILMNRMRNARMWQRPIAVHCVTATQLALALAAFEAVGTRRGDRIEHGSVIPDGAISLLRKLGLTVVTQPAFIYDRGDRYLSEVPPLEIADLYRCASLRTAGIPIAAGSDAPYASADPWLAIRTAIDRRTASGKVVGPGERVSAADALALFLGSPKAPGLSGRTVRVGQRADLCLLRAPLRSVLNAPSSNWVRATLVDGRFCYESQN